MEHSNHQPIIGWVDSIFDDDGAIASGYEEAADALVQSLAERKVGDHVFWPISYLYRHAIELHLKMALRTTYQLVGSAVSAREPHGHNIHSLFTEFDGLLEHHGYERPSEDMREAIDAIHKEDKNGQAYRYQKGNKGQRLLDLESPRVSITAIQKRYKDVLLELHGFHGLLDDTLEALREMEQE